MPSHQRIESGPDDHAIRWLCLGADTGTQTDNAKLAKAEDFGGNSTRVHVMPAADLDQAYGVTSRTAFIGFAFMQQVNGSHMPLDWWWFLNCTHCRSQRRVVVAHSAGGRQRAGVDQCPALHRRLAATLILLNKTTPAGLGKLTPCNERSDNEAESVPVSPPDGPVVLAKALWLHDGH